MGLNCSKYDRNKENEIRIQKEEENNYEKEINNRKFESSKK